MRILVLLLLGASFMAEGSKMQVRWNDFKNPVGTRYDVSRGDNDCSKRPRFRKVAFGITTKEYLDTAVVPGGRYCYYVTAIINGVESPLSNLAGARVPGNKWFNWL